MPQCAQVPTLELPPGPWHDGILLQDGTPVTLAMHNTLTHMLTVMNRAIEGLPDISKCVARPSPHNPPPALLTMTHGEARRVLCGGGGAGGRAMRVWVGARCRWMGGGGRGSERCGAAGGSPGVVLPRTGHAPTAAAPARMAMAAGASS